MKRNNKLKVAVTIITRNRHEALKKCLESVRKQTTKPDEIIVIDSSDVPLKKATKIRYKHFPQKLYQSKARNIALEMCRSDIIAYIDDDCIADEHWLENIVKGFSYKNTAAVGGPCINVNDQMKPLENIVTSSRNQNRVSFAGDIICIARKWIPPVPVETEMLAGGNMAFSANELKKIGRFDEFYDRHAAFREESDPQISLLKKGYKIMYMPGALVHHLSLKTGGIYEEPANDYFYWCGVNHKYLMGKHRFSKFWSRLSWLTFSRNPPSLPLGIFLAIMRRDSRILQWYRGLFSKMPNRR